MPSGFEPGKISFAEPLYLWLLLLPAMLLLLWVWQLVRRYGDLRTQRHTRMVPVAQRWSSVGPLAFWLAGLVACSCCILALARPQARVVTVERGAADVVVLLDGSASMYVNDVDPDRWQRSVRFLRTFADTLAWQGDRVALALFAQLASPQVRLTSDPDALFFFLDHLGTHSPFRLEDSPTWDTNIEKGIEWGVKLIEKDRELFGTSANPKAFIVISDGQSWSGEVAQALELARARRIPVHVIGVGTVQGGLIPEPLSEDGVRPAATLRAVLDRNSLREIARAGGGEYFELGSAPDRAIAARIVASAKRRAASHRTETTAQDLYWYCLLAAGVCLCGSTVFLRGKWQLCWQAAAAVVAVAVLITLW